jgi:hypothetical protein
MEAHGTTAKYFSAEDFILVFFRVLLWPIFNPDQVESGI